MWGGAGWERWWRGRHSISVSNETTRVRVANSRHGTATALRHEHSPRALRLLTSSRTKAPRALVLHRHQSFGPGCCGGSASTASASAATKASMSVRELYTYGLTRTAPHL